MTICDSLRNSPYSDGGISGTFHNWHVSAQTSLWACDGLFTGCSGEAKLPLHLPFMQYLKALGLHEENPGGVYGFAYRNQAWVVPGHLYYQTGINGQWSLVFPRAKLVITKASSKPDKLQNTEKEMNSFFTIAAMFAKKTQELMNEGSGGGGGGGGAALVGDEALDGGEAMVGDEALDGGDGGSERRSAKTKKSKKAKKGRHFNKS